MKVLLIGSHPSALQIRPHRDRLSFYYGEVYSINNAWKLLEGIPHRWLHSLDFNVLATICPTDADRQIFKEEVTNFQGSPKWYNFPGNGTMLLNGLYHIFNKHLPEGLSEIHVLGNDLDYVHGGTTHFYGGGKMTDETRRMLSNTQFAGKAADPFRYGIKPLIEALAAVKEDFAPVHVY